MVAVTRSICISRSTTLVAKKISIIYYLLSIIYYLKSPGCASGFCPPAPPGVTFSGRIRRGVACVRQCHVRAGLVTAREPQNLFRYLPIKEQHKTKTVGASREAP